ncbi:Vba4 protein [Saccharomycopsis crataegensis]|uniref:Vba4 protein n=1 Tax=Saccharomycopsis crataegensis TaxID=43959 RepID=A0AAV5QJG7_9ASCO|nr:Vba4 protein [Saccharomycopsis crataegensis]
MASMSQQQQPLLDPSTTSPGLVATEISTEIDEQIGNYGSIDHQPDEPQINIIDEPVLSPGRQKVILFSIYVSIFLGALDTTIVATLLTTIASDLDALPQVSWIATSYLLSCSAFQPLFGKLSDIFGRKRLLLICNVMFAGGCLLCGVAPKFWQLSLGRFITGIGGGGFNTLGTITMSDIIPLRERGVYQGYGNIAYGLGAASGGIVAGFFSSWRWAFLLQIPICLFTGTMILCYLNLPKGSPGLGVHGHDVWTKFSKIDLLGSFILVSSLIAFMLAASIGGKDISFGSGTFLSLISGSIFGLFLFYQYELRVAKEPVIPVHLLKQQTVLASSFNCFFMSMTMFTMIYFAPFFWTSVKGYTASASGLRLVSNFLGVSTGSIMAGHYMHKTGKYYKLALVSGIASIVGLFQVWLLGEDSNDWYELIVLFLPGLGTAVMLTVSLVAMISSVDHKEQALTTSIQYGFRSVGSTLGVAIATAFFEESLQRNLVKNFQELRNVPPGYTEEMLRQIIDQAMRSSSYAFVEAPKFAKQAILSAYDRGCHAAILFGLIACVISVICNLFIKEHPLTGSMKRT